MFNSFFVLLMILTSLYFSYFVYRFFKIVLHHRLSVVLMIGIYFLIFYMSRCLLNFLELKAVIYFHIVVVSLFLEIPYMLFKKNKLIQSIIPTGILCCVIVSGIFGYGYYRIHHIVEKRYVLQSDHINDLKIALIADMHMGVSIDQKKLKSICQKISEQKVDIVALDGDIFDENTSYQDMKAACKILGQIESRLGIYYVFGNHDSNHYTLTPAYDVSTLEKELEKNHIVVLNDDVRIIEDVMIIGRRDAGYYQDGERLTMQELYPQHTQHFVLVLDHQPLDLQTNASLKVDLQLSGHTHGGQLFPQGLIQSLTSDTLVYGKRKIGELTAITTSGISGWRYPIKTGAPSEYVIIEIKS